MSVNPLYIALAMGVIVGVAGYAQTRQVVPAVIAAAVAFAVIWLGARLLAPKRPPAS